LNSKAAEQEATLGVTQRETLRVDKSVNTKTKSGIKILKMS